MRLTILLSLIMLAPAAHADSVSGTWTNVRVDDRNGDTRGMIVELRDGSVIVTDCEKQCGTPVSATATVTGRRMAFRVALKPGVISRFTGEVRDDGTLVLRREGKAWNAVILQPAGAGRDEETAPVRPAAIAGPPPESQTATQTQAPVVRVATNADADAGRLAGYYSNIVYREGAEHTQGMAIKFHPGAPPSVTVHDCDIYCDQAYAVPVQVQGNRIRYTLTGDMKDMPANGRRFAGEFRRDGTLKVWGEGYRRAARVLRRQAKE